jgi:hypothetical protein
MVAGPGILRNLGRNNKIASHTLAIYILSRSYLEVLRFEWDERKNRGNRAKHGVKKLRAPSAIRMRASSLILNAQRKRIGLSSSG